MNRKASTPGTSTANAVLVAGAIADALGWPQELNNKRRKKDRQSQNAEWVFRDWTRNVGGRFYEHEQYINAGSYSDDTQLTLCTARSILTGDNWLQSFRYVELPAFEAYERGSGKATKQAIQSWLSGIEPWYSPTIATREAYFSAGANGALMRIAPHCLDHISENNFSKLAMDIFLNAISTHGHPRAILGALCFGFCLWYGLRLERTLQYGELLQAIVENQATWSKVPESEEIERWWQLSSSLYPNTTYLWNETINELLEQTSICLQSLKMQSLSIDHAILDQLGALGTFRGSGTVTAIAAIFLASRFASEPETGLLEAAFTEGADTDTLASATAQLLAAINGERWLSPLSEEVQDHFYIKTISQMLLHKVREPNEKAWVHTTDIQKFKSHLLELKRGDGISFVDGRTGNVASILTSKAKSPTVNANIAAISLTDGQSIYVPIIQRDSRGKQAQLQIFQNDKQDSSMLDLDNANQTSGVIKDSTNQYIVVTPLPNSALLFQLLQGSKEIGSLIAYESGEAVRCLSDTGIKDASKVIRQLVVDKSGSIERQVIPVKPNDGLIKWNLNKVNETPRESERIAKLWIESLIKTQTGKTLEQLKFQKEDTRSGCTFRWTINQKSKSLNVELQQLVKFLKDVALRKSIQQSIQRLTDT